MLILGPDKIQVQNTEKKGKGVFAADDIPGGTVIADYLGKIILPDEEDETKQNGVYGMCWRGDFSILPDLSQVGAHTVNHSCMPNAVYYPYQGHILITATRKIFSGEEISTSYLIDPEACVDFPCHHGCFCNTPVCTGTMHSSHAISGAGWDNFVREKQGSFLNSDFPLGSTLEPLTSYPGSLPDDNFFPLYGNLSQPGLILDETRFPSLQLIRQLISQQGQVLHCSKLGIRILGVTPNRHILISTTD